LLIYSGASFEPSRASYTRLKNEQAMKQLGQRKARAQKKATTYKKRSRLHKKFRKKYVYCARMRA
jgi:hypothetical protein